MILNHINLQELIEIQLIEHYVMVLKIMDILHKLVIIHVNNTNILLYKMGMVNKDGVVVIMN